MRKCNILIVVLVFATVLGGCITEKDVHKYSGIEKTDISDLSDRAKVEFVHVYKGSTENWAATFFVYRMIGEENHIMKLFMKFTGEKSQPAGQLRYSYETDGNGGHGTLPSDSKNGIYNLGQSGGIGAIPSKDALVSFKVEWNGQSESFDLKPEK